MLEVNNAVIMADISDILIELRRQLNLNGIQRFNKTIDSGHNIQTNCPFHKGGQERKPSFGISKIDGVCHCFGCGWTGTLDEMVSGCFGYTDLGIFGSKWLIKNFLTVQVNNRTDLDLNFSRCQDKNAVVDKPYVTEEELDSYRYYHEYMWKRKLTKEVVELFDIGYDKKTQCLTFPNRDVNGNCLFVARRSVKTKFFNYPSDVEKPVYGLYELNLISRKEYNCIDKHILYSYPEEIIICESMLDALTCWVYGKYAIALNGLGNESQFKQLNSMPCRKFIIATDMDEAGLKARQRIKSRLKNKIVTEYVWDLNIAKDINDMSEDYFHNLKEVF